MRYNNYHKHTHYSNVSTLDCVVKPIDYINRAKELGHTIYFTTEHGYQGNIFEAHQLCEENNLKCVYAVEAYYVDNMYDKSTRTNYHIVLVAMTNNGRKEINKIISKAYTEGFYYKPRIDLKCLLSLKYEDVVITTACVAGRLFKGDDWLNKFFIPVYKHFKDHLFLEIQNHNEHVQKVYNKKILELHKKYGVSLIHGNDSHYIFSEDSKIRDKFLYAKGMVYEEETNFVLDYPDYDEIVRRYDIQGIIPKDLVEEALANTLIFDKAEDIDLNYEFKLPKIFKDKDSNEHLKEILYSEFKRKIPYRIMIKEERDKYITALRYEYNIIKKCGMADYFILDYYIVKKAVEKYDAILTRSGRGSAVSFFINYLLGFTQVNRLNSPIKLYPTRFMSAERILSSRSLPDIDLNFADVKPVLRSSKDYLGEDGVYYMISYKPLQDSSAFRLWCKSNDMDINEYNEIAKNLDDYREDSKWCRIIEDSKVFVGTIESISPSPCSVLLLDKPISEEIGLIKVGDVMCCSLDGYYCDVYKYLKNDYLIVSVYSIISNVYKLLGKPIDTVEELLKKCDSKVWDLYKEGLTTTINQADSDYDKQILRKYKPKNLAELSAYVAAIRPGFSSLLNNFVERKTYSTGVKQLDDILKDSFHYLLYQESIMSYLIWLGIPEKETYDIIKKMSKKKFKQYEIDDLKAKLRNNWLKKLGNNVGFEETWKVVEDATRYSFNASHSLCVAIDSLYGAYLKSHYPIEYFTVALNLYNGDLVRTNNLVNELSYFDLTIKPIIFGKSLSEYTMDKSSNSIYKGIGSIKYCNSQIAEELYMLSKYNYDNFVDLLIKINTDTSVNARQLDILVKLNFFRTYGGNKYLLQIIDLFNKRPKKQVNKNKLDTLGIPEYLVKKYSNNETPSLYKDIDSIGLIKEMAQSFDRSLNINIIEQMKSELEYLGYIEYKNSKVNKDYYFIKECKVTKYSTATLIIRNINNGEEIPIRIKSSKVFKTNPVKKFNVIKIYKMREYFKKRPNSEGKWVAINETEMILEEYEVIK